MLVGLHAITLVILLQAHEDAVTAMAYKACNDWPQHVPSA